MSKLIKLQIEFYSNYHWGEGVFLFNILPSVYISDERGFITIGVGWLFWGFEIYKGE